MDKEQRKKISEREFSIKRSVIRELNIPELEQRKIRVFVKRDDLIHPLVSGNKWRKLKYSLLQADAMKCSGIITFGGAYSNHLIACAYACKVLGFESVGFVRGEELNVNSNENLRTCAELGMKLVFMDRLTYQLRNDFEYQKELKQDFPGFYLIPEGGANFYGMIGCQEIWKELPFFPDHLFLAQGTCTTSCGLLSVIPEETSLHVVPVLKGFDSLSEMKKLLGTITFDEEMTREMLEKVTVHDQYHFGAYGKTTDELISFLSEMEEKYALPLDPVYTGKAFYGMMKEIQGNRYDGKTVLFLHTGGLSGSTRGIE